MSQRDAAQICTYRLQNTNICKSEKAPKKTDKKLCGTEVMPIGDN
jgi:hypothetical protein